MDFESGAQIPLSLTDSSCVLESESGDWSDSAWTRSWTHLSERESRALDTSWFRNVEEAPRDWISLIGAVAIIAALESRGAPRRLLRSVRRAAEILRDSSQPEFASNKWNGLDPLRSVRAWTLEAIHLGARFPRSVVVTGWGPFGPDEPDKLSSLVGWGCSFSSEPTAEIGVLLVGRYDWDRERIDEQIDLRRQQELRVYSEEMLVAFIQSGHDPFEQPLSLPIRFGDHPAIRFVASGWSGWVSTCVDGMSRSKLPTLIAPPDSPLSRAGYSVRERGPSALERRAIIRSVFNQGNDEWGEARSADRLYHIAHKMAAYCRNFKHRERRSDQAIEKWESDLSWLKSEFYHGHYAFEWPKTRS